MQETNFGRNIAILPRRFFTPTSEDEVLDILNSYKGERIRCVGRRHSWSDILTSDGILLDLRELNFVEPQKNKEALAVRVGAGCQIKRLLAELQQCEGWTLPSVGFITEQTIAGAIATGTHGSGRHSLSHYVISVRVARYDPDSGQAVIEEITAGEELRAARCSLGCIGVILSVTMQCRPSYGVEENFQEYSQLGDVLHAEDEFPLQQFYLVPWRWTYVAQHRRETQAPKSASLAVYHWYRFIVFDLAMHLLILFVVRILRMRSAVRAAFRWILPNCVIRGWRVVGPSNSQLVMEHELFRHVEMELFVQRDQLAAALSFLKNTLTAAASKTAKINADFQMQLEAGQRTQEMARLRGTYCHHYPICVRKILPDDTLISMASNATGIASHALADTEPAGGAWYSITLTNYHRGQARKPFEELAQFLAVSMAQMFGARPHWGKLCPIETEALLKLYPAFKRFARVCTSADPDRRFCNQWTTALLDQRTNA